MSTSKEKYGEFLNTFNKIEAILNQTISQFCSPTPAEPSQDYNFRAVVFNHSLFDQKIFLGFQQKINFLNKINNYIDEKAKKVIYNYDKNKWNALRKNIISLQEKRNKLAHGWLAFSDEVNSVEFNE